MLVSLGLVAVLDGTILSVTPDLTRALLALALTAVVGGFVVAVWRSNIRLEKAAEEQEKGGQGGTKPAAGNPRSK
jgi:hypothetical protein